jgi:ABC-type polysaccharide/polyol phosphate transport system ATPase subunit
VGGLGKEELFCFMGIFDSKENQQAQAAAEGQEVPAISVQDVYLSYRSIAPVQYGKKQAKASGFKDDSFKTKGRVEHFEALHGVSFEIGKGEIVGLIGRNGSGKSTLLRVLAGIFEPDRGNVELYGHTVSLLALGVGFQTQLSGRDNIYLSGLLLGFTKEEIDQQIDEIIDFSELGRFIEQPVRTYSSGMQSKLGFAITAVLKTDIILVDEVLSVGDAHFKKKSGKKMAELISDKSRTVVIVSHNMDTIRANCDKVIWLHDGDLYQMGPTKEVVEAYETFMAQYDVPDPKKTKK